MLLKEALLDGIELAFFFESFDSRDVPAVGLHGEHGAGLHRHTVEEHGTGAAMRRVAADVRARQPQVLAQEMNEKQSRFDFALARGAVDVDGDVVFRHGYSPCARATAFARARAVKTRDISFLYSTEPRRSAAGDVA